MTDDDFIESGWYVDRRGWHWFRIDHRLGQWHHYEQWGEWHLSDTQMRLLIERDQHRDVCPGLYACHTHPVPIVWSGPASGRWFVDYGNWHNTLPEAMDAARALAVGE